MITIQHTLMGLLTISRSFRKQLPYLLLPDAIRMYTGARQYSHFEKSEDGDLCSYIMYPISLEGLNKAYMQELYLLDSGYLVPGIRPCCMGEETSIETFVDTNAHLPIWYFKGVFNHLVQDVTFDEFIRKHIDCTRMYEDVFVFKNEQMNGKKVRELIAAIEQQGYYYLASIAYDKYKVIANQDWFDSSIKPILFEEYPQELAENTYNYMKINETINEKITNIDFDHIDGPLSKSDYDELYRNVIANTIFYTNNLGV